MFNLHLVTAALLLSGATKINGLKTIKGQLLTPDDGCGVTKVPHKKIVGGSDAKPGAWPWMAALAYYADEFKCGGSLITSRHILTAGHCVTNELSFVRLGGHDRYSYDGPQKDLKVVHTELHPKYKTSSGTDIAILYLEKDVEFTDLIRPICLPLEKPLLTKSFVGQNPFLAGWGRTGEWETGSQYLKEAQLPVIDNKKCKELFAKRGVVKAVDINDSVLCAGDLTGKNSGCYGDSGGPLMMPILNKGTFPYYQIGVASFTKGCEQKDSPAGFASVQYHADWIKEMVAKKIK